MAKKIVIILNGISRKKKKFYKQVLPGLEEKFDITVWETKHQEHARDLATEAVQINPIGIFAAGGDGTMNQVLNGILHCAHDIRPPMGVIPLGTGNDFSKLNNIHPTAESIIGKMERGARPTDVGKISCYNEKGEAIIHYFINVASMGMGPEVVRRLFKSNRALGPTLTYAKASIETFFAHKPESIEITADSWRWGGKVRVLAIANGQSFGGGLYVAPDAQPDDGVLSVFIAGEIPLFKFLTFLQQIKAIKKIKDNHIHYSTGKTVSLKSSQKLWIETEGELVGTLPAEVEVVPGGIQFFR